MFEALTARLPRVLKLEGPVHGEIAADTKATTQAIVVTAVAALIASLTSADGDFITRLIGAIILAPIGLFIWSGIAFLLGKMFGGTADYISLVRPIGYSAAPYALGIVPVIGQLVGVVYSALIQVKIHQEVNGLAQGAAIAVVVIPLAVLIGLSFILALLGLALLAGLGGFGDLAN
jgi:hypothetical protein